MIARLARCSPTAKGRRPQQSAFKAMSAVSNAPAYRCPQLASWREPSPPLIGKGTARMFRSLPMNQLAPRVLMIVTSFILVACQNERAVDAQASLVWLDYFVWKDGTRRYIQIARD